MSTAKEIGDELKAKRAEWFALYDSRPAKDYTDEEVETLKTLQVEMTDLGEQWEKVGLEESAAALRKQAERQREMPKLPTPRSTRQDEHPQVKSLRQLFAESSAYQAFRTGAIKSAQIEIPEDTYQMELGQKTLLTSADWTFLSDRQPNVLQSVTPNVTVSDLMLPGTTDSPTISYMEETTFTNAAAEVAEGATKPESALDFTETTETVRKIATWIPVTDELLADVPAMESYIRGRLAFMVERRRELQLISGNGTPPNLRGILNRSGIQTQAKATDPTPDAFYKAMVKIMVNADADPTGMVIHPNDWQDIRLLRTADGIYIWGSPSENGVERMWGLPVRVTTAITENTGLVGAFRPYAQLFRRSGLAITVSTEHSTYFIENKVLLLAEERLALAVYRPSAFCTVTGI